MALNSFGQYLDELNVSEMYIMSINEIQGIQYVFLGVNARPGLRPIWLDEEMPNSTRFERVDTSYKYSITVTDYKGDYRRYIFLSEEEYEKYKDALKEQKRV